MSRIFFWLCIQLMISFVVGSPLSPNGGETDNSPWLTCGNIKCAGDEECVQPPNILCVRPPCPHSNAYCKKRQTTTTTDTPIPPRFPTCDEIQCAEDEKCVLTGIDCCCEPCPPYTPSCVNKDQ